MCAQQSEFVPRDSFIAAMRQVASSVTVVTSDGPAGRYGATVSAFSSVSADPPTILVCLFAESRIAAAIKGNGSYCVNVLPEDRADIADRFAGHQDSVIKDRFSGIACSSILGASPQIDGAICFQAKVHTIVTSGSHLIVLGHVRDVLSHNTSPLAYRNGCYHRVVPQDLVTAATGN